jgi:hypothetical protein
MELVSSVAGIYNLNFMDDVALGTLFFFLFSFNIYQYQIKGKVKVTDSQSASLSWCQATMRARDQFCFLLEISLDSCGLIIFWRPLWRKDGSVSYCAAGPRKRSLSRV